MSAREEILAAVRRATAGAAAPAPAPRGYRDRPEPDREHVVALFAERVADYRAVVERCTEENLHERIVAALAGAERVLVPAGTPWTVAGAHDGAGLSAADLDGYDAVLTAATVGIAETGTIVLTHGPGEGRRALTLVPDRHVCVVRTDQVVPGVVEAVARLGEQATRPQTWISGPSATSDIELSRVEGVHGPRNLHVLVVD